MVDGSKSSISNGARKIVLVTDAWFPQRNGVVRVLQALIPRLEARGYEVRVIEPNQFTTIPLPIYPEIRLALFSKRRITQIVEEFQPDAVCLVTEGPLGWAARSVCKRKGIPFITWYHSHFPLYVDVRFHGLIRPVTSLIRRFHQEALRTMVSTESLKKELESVGYTNMVIMPLGVDTELFVRNPAPPPSNFPRPIFVYFSRLAPEKNPEGFLSLNLPGTKLVIGDGPLRRKLEQKYPEAKFLGRYDVGKEFVDQLSVCDVFVFPSKTETFGLVALEALACGIPVAAHDVMGPRDIVTEGKDGYLGDDLAEAAVKCLSLSREDCRKKAEQYSWEHSADALIKNLFLN